MCLQLSGAGSGCQQMHSQSKGCPYWQQCPSPQSSLFMASHLLRIIVALNSLFLTWYACECVSVAWRELRLSYQDNGRATAWEPPLPTRPSHSQGQLRGVFVSSFLWVCVSLSPWVVIFTQPYSVTAQIINYSSPRERDPKRGSVTLPVVKGEQGVSAKL